MLVHFFPGRTVKELYTRIEQLEEEALIKVEVTYIEIYNEEIKDLINAGEDRPHRPLKVGPPFAYRNRLFQPDRATQCSAFTIHSS